MGYNRFVQVGRVVRVTYGPHEGKLATIVDVLGTNRVLIDGEDVPREIINVQRIQLTSQVIGVKRGAKHGKVKAIVKKEKVAEKFAASSLGKAYARQARRQSLTDFERFKVLTLRRKLSKLTRAKVAKK
eukprot:TRINITY_DN38054_c0_g1_i1.p1 TRINITY_DN38054_c0_g1~~TRINITY_DN38054_c0_g1_i1.p1  ORF type:complete len:129 (+),score=24.45 TRINITY_DN38054_c0_g1_i1:25-411(+)